MKLENLKMSTWHSLSGYLQYKPGGALTVFKSKRKVWCVLDEQNHQLLYYKSEDDIRDNVACQGSINIGDCAINLDLDNQNQFIILSDGKDHIFTAENHESMLIWLLALQNHGNDSDVSSGTEPTPQRSQSLVVPEVESRREKFKGNRAHVNCTTFDQSSRSGFNWTSLDKSSRMQLNWSTFDHGNMHNLNSSNLDQGAVNIVKDNAGNISTSWHQDMSHEDGSIKLVTHSSNGSTESDDVFVSETSVVYPIDTRPRRRNSGGSRHSSNSPLPRHHMQSVGEESQASTNSVSSDSAIDRGDPVSQSHVSRNRILELESDLIQSKCELAKVMNVEAFYQDLIEQKNEAIRELTERIEKSDSESVTSDSFKKGEVNHSKPAPENIRILQNQNKILNKEIKRLAQMRVSDRSLFREQQMKLQASEADTNTWKAEYVKIIQSSIRLSDVDTNDEPVLKLYGGSQPLRKVQELLMEARKYNPGLPSYESLSSKDTHVDNFGFKHNFENEGLLLHYLCQELHQHYIKQAVGYSDHCAHWKRFLRQYGKTLSKDIQDHWNELKDLCSKGVPEEFRQQVWCKLIFGRIGDIVEQKGAHYFRNLCNTIPNSPLAAHYKKQISLDLMRTMPDNIRFSTAGSKGIMDLQDVLLAYCLHSPSTGYCQGMNFIAGMFLLFLDANDTFWALVAVTERYFSTNYFDHNLIGAQADQFVLQDLVVEKLPQLAHHFESMDIEISTVTLNWFLAIFFDSVPFQLYDEMELPRKPDIVTLRTGYLKNLKEKYRKQEYEYKISRHSDDAYLVLEAEAAYIQHKAIICATEVSKDGKLWFCFSDESTSHFCQVNCQTGLMNEVSWSIDSPVLCMTTFRDKTIIVGLLSWMVVAFDTQSMKEVWSLHCHDAVLSLCYYNQEGVSRIFAGLADGTIAAIDQPKNQHTDLDVLYIPVGQSPVTSLIVHGTQLWCASGNAVVIFHASTLEAMDSLVVSKDPYEIVQTLCCSDNGVWMSFRGSSIIELWDTGSLHCKLLYNSQTGKCTTNKKVDDEFNKARITSMLALNETVWIGTGDGNLVIYEVVEQVQSSNSSDRFLELKRMFAGKGHDDVKFPAYPANLSKSLETFYLERIHDFSLSPYKKVIDEKYSADSSPSGCTLKDRCLSSPSLLYPITDGSLCSEFRSECSMAMSRSSTLNDSLEALDSQSTDMETSVYAASTECGDDQSIELAPVRGNIEGGSDKDANQNKDSFHTSNDSNWKSSDIINNAYNKLRGDTDLERSSKAHCKNTSHGSTSSSFTEITNPDDILLNKNTILSDKVECLQNNKGDDLLNNNSITLTKGCSDITCTDKVLEEYSRGLGFSQKVPNYVCRANTNGDKMFSTCKDIDNLLDDYILNSEGNNNFSCEKCSCQRECQKFQSVKDKSECIVNDLNPNPSLMNPDDVTVEFLLDRSAGKIQSCPSMEALGDSSFVCIHEKICPSMESSNDTIVVEDENHGNQTIGIDESSYAEIINNKGEKDELKVKDTLEHDNKIVDSTNFCDAEEFIHIEDDDEEHFQESVQEIDSIKNKDVQDDVIICSSEDEFLDSLETSENTSDNNESARKNSHSLEKSSELQVDDKFNASLHENINLDMNRNEKNNSCTERNGGQCKDFPISMDESVYIQDNYDRLSNEQSPTSLSLTSPTNGLKSLEHFVRDIIYDVIDNTVDNGACENCGKLFTGHSLNKHSEYYDSLCSCCYSAVSAGKQENQKFPEKDLEYYVNNSVDTSSAEENSTSKKNNLNNYRTHLTDSNNTRNESHHRPCWSSTKIKNSETQWLCTEAKQAHPCSDAFGNNNVMPENSGSPVVRGHNYQVVSGNTNHTDIKQVQGFTSGTRSPPSLSEICMEIYQQNITYLTASEDCSASDSHPDCNKNNADQNSEKGSCSCNFHDNRQLGKKSELDKEIFPDKMCNMVYESGKTNCCEFLEKCNITDSDVNMRVEQKVTQMCSSAFKNSFQPPGIDGLGEVETNEINLSVTQRDVKISSHIPRCSSQSDQLRASEEKLLENNLCSPIPHVEQQSDFVQSSFLNSDVANSVKNNLNSPHCDPCARNTMNMEATHLVDCSEISAIEGSPTDSKNLSTPNNSGSSSIFTNLNDTNTTDNHTLRYRLDFSGVRVEAGIEPPKPRSKSVDVNFASSTPNSLPSNQQRRKRPTSLSTKVVHSKDVSYEKANNSGSFEESTKSSEKSLMFKNFAGSSWGSEKGKSGSFEESIKSVDKSIGSKNSAGTSLSFPCIDLDIQDGKSDSSTDRRIQEFLRTPSFSLSASSSLFSSYDNISVANQSAMESENSEDTDVPEKHYIHTDFWRHQLSTASSTSSIWSDGETSCMVKMNLLVKMKISDKPIRYLMPVRCSGTTNVVSFSGCHGDDEAVLVWRKDLDGKMWTNDPVLEICEKTKRLKMPMYMKASLMKKSPRKLTRHRSSPLQGGLTSSWQQLSLSDNR